MYRARFGPSSTCQRGIDVTPASPPRPNVLGAMWPITASSAATEMSHTSDR